MTLALLMFTARVYRFFSSEVPRIHKNAIRTLQYIKIMLIVLLIHPKIFTIYCGQIKQ